MYYKKYKNSFRELKNIKTYRKTFIIYITLTLFLALFIFYFGIPLVIKILNISESFKTSATPAASNDNVPPINPKFLNIPLYTNQDSIEIQGTGEPDSNVVLIFNGKEYQMLVNSDGIFTSFLDLSNGVNTVYAYSTDSSNNKSQNSPEFNIVLDKEPPTIEILKPPDKSNYYGQSSQVVAIEGKTEAQSKTTINERLSYVNEQGIFKYNYSLKIGENIIIVKTIDNAGNPSEKTITLYYSE